MTNKTKHPRAFPLPVSDNNMGYEGMTLRDYFAAHAPKMTKQYFKDGAKEGLHFIELHAEWAYKYANAMLAERSKDA